MIVPLEITSRLTRSEFAIERDGRLVLNEQQSTVLLNRRPAPGEIVDVFPPVPPGFRVHARRIRERATGGQYGYDLVQTCEECPPPPPDIPYALPVD